MDKKSTKIFSIFWLISGAAWTTAAVRTTTSGDDWAGTAIYATAAVVSFVLAFAFYRGFLRS